MKKRTIFFIVIIVVTLACFTYPTDEKCNVHNVNMKSGMVPIAYGLPGAMVPYGATEKYFPNATSPSGGCSPNPFHLFTRLSFCDKCREIKKEVQEDYHVLMGAVYKLREVMTIEDLNNILSGCKNELTSEISRLIIDDYVEHIKTCWVGWQKSFNAAYNDALKYDKDKNLRASYKAHVWQLFTDSFSNDKPVSASNDNPYSFSMDNPYSTEDQLIRNQAMNRLKYWKNYREPKSTFDKTSSINLRSSYRDLSVSQVWTIPNVSVSERKSNGFYGHSTIKHDYDVRTINSDVVIIDHATGLIWTQNNSTKQVVLDQAKEWVKNLNSRGYAGYHDWRLPTLEEAVTLLEPDEKQIGPILKSMLYNTGSSFSSTRNYVDPIFNNRHSIWTGDKNSVSEGPWFVNFYNGRVGSGVSRSISSVLPVRSGK
jgi:hypothetical protein